MENEEINFVMSCLIMSFENCHVDNCGLAFYVVLVRNCDSLFSW